MIKLDELIKESCPSGVEYQKIGNAVEYEQPTKYIVTSTDYNDCEGTPVLTAGQTFILGYTNEKDGIYAASKEKPVIIFDDFTGAFKWVDFPFKVKSSAMKMLTAKKDVAILRYIYHCMGHLDFSSSEHKRLWIGIYSEFQIPVPPIPVQEEIVRILDSFTELTAELAAELAARKKQYEYYRDKLLSFKEEL
jgi:type I restriction enzyme S subunit